MIGSGDRAFAAVVIAALRHRPTAEPAPAGGVDLSGARLIALRAEVAARHMVTLEEMCGASRKAAFVRARQDFFLAAARAGFSAPRIAKACGGRDHTTVLHGIRRAQEREGAT